MFAEVNEQYTYHTPLTGERNGYYRRTRRSCLPSALTKAQANNLPLFEVRVINATMKCGSLARKRPESLAWAWAEVHREELALHPDELLRSQNPGIDPNRALKGPKIDWCENVQKRCNGIRLRPHIDEQTLSRF
jgi:hypothetical protein